MKNFHKLKVIQVEKDKNETVKISLEIPLDKKTFFSYKAGQYISVKLNLQNEEQRRSYSICDAPSENKNSISILVKQLKGGLVSTYLNQVLEVEDVLECMPPMGGFFPSMHPDNQRVYFGLAAGSGISPIISNLKEILTSEPQSAFHLLFGCQNAQTILCENEINTLKDKYGERLQIAYFFSQENSDKNNSLYGRINPETLTQYFNLHQNIPIEDSFFMLCGPTEMIKNCSDFLKKDKKVPALQVMYEYFSSPDEEGQEEMSEEFKAIPNLESMVTVIIDDDEYSFHLNSKKESILDKALKDKLPVPFACKGGVCCTCKAQVMEGEVFMEKNYALTEDEVAKGYVLSCQCHPTTNIVMLNFDV